MIMQATKTDRFSMHFNTLIFKPKSIVQHFIIRNKQIMWLNMFVAQQKHYQTSLVKTLIVLILA